MTMIMLVSMITMLMTNLEASFIRIWDLVLATVGKMRRVMMMMMMLMTVLMMIMIMIMLMSMMIMVMTNLEASFIRIWDLVLATVGKTITCKAAETT